MIFEPVSELSAIVQVIEDWVEENSPTTVAVFVDASRMMHLLRLDDQVFEIPHRAIVCGSGYDCLRLKHIEEGEPPPSKPKVFDADAELENA